jgi:hypothetical protein
MKKEMVFLIIIVFAMMLAVPISGAEAPKPGVSDQKQQMQPMPPGGVVPLRHDFKVERVFIAKTATPNVPFAGPFYTNENYTLACEISYAGGTNTDPVSPCVGTGSSAAVAYKIDGSLILDFYSGCLAPNEPKTYFSHAFASQSYMARAFTAGNHSYECLITQTDLPDSNTGNNTKSMSYQIMKPHKTEQPNRPRPY